MVHRFSGKVRRLFVDREQCFIQLSGIDVSKDSYFQLTANHPNYNAMYSLALSAAINSYVLQVRTAGEVEAVPKDQYPHVRYLVVDW
jgi:hypothetical protein